MAVSLQGHEKLHRIVADVLGVDPGSVSDDSTTESIEQWDSLNHLHLVMAIEEAYELSLTPEDVLSMRSVSDIRSIISAATPSESNITFEDCHRDYLPELRAFIARSYGENYVLCANSSYLDWQFGSPKAADDHLNIRVALFDGRIAGCLGYIPVQLDIAGRTLQGAWLANWMIDPDHRDLGLGPLLVGEVSRQFEVSLAVGASQGARAILTRMGWSDFGTLRRYVHVLDTQQAAKLVENGTLDWPDVPDSMRTPLPAATSVRRVDRLDNSVEELWEKIWASRQTAAGTRRSAQFLNWRYADHPEFDYRLFEMRRGGELAGLAVYRVESVRGLPTRVGRIVELVADCEAAGWLVDALLDDAVSNGVIAVDFFCGADDLSVVLRDRGFLPGEHPSAAEIPLLYQPIDRRKKGITFLADLRNVNEAPEVIDWYVTKADGDQDRPN